MKKTDRKLGMEKTISRRDFVEGVGLASLGLGFGNQVLTAEKINDGYSTSPDPQAYPPVRTGLRGAHPGSFEWAHAIRDNSNLGLESRESPEAYDLIVVGGGISGLSAAYFYLREYGEGSRILILDNHDDFGGHAKRNEFHHEGIMRLAIGGAHNLEYESFSPKVWSLMKDLKIDFRKLSKQTDFHYGDSGVGPGAIFFDKAHFGESRLVRGADFRYSSLRKMQLSVRDFPVSAQSIARWESFFSMKAKIFLNRNKSQIEKELRKISYFDFLEKFAGLCDEEFDLLRKISHGSEGFGVDGLSAMEALEISLPGSHLLGESFKEEEDYTMVMFPDGNASLARLLVSKLIPDTAKHVSPDNIAIADFDYSQLDLPASNVRIRLNSTVVNVLNVEKGVQATYCRDNVVEKVQARHCVMACYHSMIPFICPELPDYQKRAQAYQVKCPLVLTNVLIRSGDPFRRLGISGAYCPGNMHANMYLLQGINSGGYEHRWSDNSGTATVMFWGSIAPPARLRSSSVKSQIKASRKKMLDLKFSDYERDVRHVLNELLGHHGFKVEEDILAITVNRWPHGYSYWYLDLWDPEFKEGEYPHQIARRKCGSIAIANSDAAADAYAHSAIDQAWRAVRDLTSAEKI